MALKFLVVCEFWYGSAGWSYQHTLEELGCNVVVFDYRRPWVRWRAGGVRPVRRVVDLINQVVMNERLARCAEAVRPDVILVTKGETIFPRTLEKLRGYGRPLLFNYNADSPFNGVNSSSELLASIPIYDCHFAWAEHLIERFCRAGARRVEYLPFGYDPCLFHPVSVTEAERQRHQCEISFAGTWEPAREGMLEGIAGWDLSIWGNMWENVAEKSCLHSHVKGKAIYGDGLCRRLGCSKIVLNFLRAQNDDATNMRTFEIPGLGRFLLTTRSKEQGELFEEGREIACFGSAEELRESVAYYLNHDEEREAIARRGHARAVREHTVTHRLRQVLNVVERLER